MDIITMEKGVPIPETRGRRAIYPFAEMEVGDSFVTPTSVHSSISKFKKTHPGWSFKHVKVSPNKFRVWRIS